MAIAMPQQCLGEIYYWGNGVPKTHVRQPSGIGFAADQGIADSQYLLGLMYASSRGTVEDYVMAHMWFDLAAVGGDAQRIKFSDGFLGSLTPDQIAEAQRLARECLAAQAPIQCRASGSHSVVDCA